MLKNLRKKINDKIKKFDIPQAKHIYYFVPPCPVCGGWHTGRYIRKSMTDPDYVYRKSLEHGEIIRQVAREPIKNCFCEECGYEWGAHIETIWLTTDEIMEQSHLRGAYEQYEQYKKENFVNGKPQKSSAFNRWFL